MKTLMYALKTRRVRPSRMLSMMEQIKDQFYLIISHLNGIQD